MADTVQQIKDRLSIQEVVGQYVTLTRAGSTYKARCPFHAERTPSFIVSPHRGTYHCFGCGAGGDMFTFVQEIEGLDFKGALKMLADRAGVEVTFERPEARDAREQQFAALADAALFFANQLTDTHAARAYLHKRGVTDATITSFHIGWAPDEWHALTSHLRSRGHSERSIEATGLAKRSEKSGQGSARLYDRFRSRIMFPIYDSAGRVVAFSGRIFGTVAETPTTAKYINSPETELFRKSQILYGYDRAKQAIRKYNFSILVEGQMDLVMSHQAGWTNAVAVSGTALTPEHVALLQRMSDNLVLALDADEAGVRAAGKSAKVALQRGMDVKVAVLPPSVDPADLIVAEGSDGWKKVIRTSVHIIPFLLETLERTARDARAFRLAAERTVVPFLAVIKSPIDREHFVHEVAARLGVSESTIQEAVATAAAHAAVEAPDLPSEQRDAPSVSRGRLRQLLGLLLWQESIAEAQIDPQALAKDIDTAAGDGTVVRLRELSTEEQESLRFTAERLYGESEHLTDDARALLSAVLRERLQKELAEATVSLRVAEGKGEEDASNRALEQCRILTGRIAELDKTVYSIDSHAAKAA